MQFISRLTKRLRPSTRKDLTTVAAVVSVLLFGLGVLATYIFVHTTQTQREDDYTRFQQAQLHDTSTYVHNKLANYGQILLAGATAVHIQGDMGLTREDWHTFVRTTHAVSAFPELLAIGFAQHISAAELEAYTQQVRATVYPDFAVRPAGERGSYDIIKYDEPVNDVNTGAIGFDISSERERAQALAYARDNADFSMTSPITLGRDIAETADPPQSIIMFYPVYTSVDPPTTVAERRQQLEGYVFVAFRVRDMMSQRNDDISSRPISYDLTDLTSEPAQELYDFDSPMMASGHQKTIRSKFEVISRTWQVTMQVPKSGLTGQLGPNWLFAAGLVASAGLAIAVFMLLRWRIDHVKNAYEQDIENTKDELLALASHQLRTPATGVKQYLGMLLEGLFGDIDPDQRSLIERAYKANDLQLEIIDQLLYVAKADAGQLIVRRDKLDLKKIIISTVETMRPIAAQKNITIRTKLPKDAVIRGDERLIRMIMENLISNAIKYSHPDKTVTVSLRINKQQAVIRIKDQGIGIDEPDHDKLFRKFSRVTNEFTRQVEGSGLGLYLAAKLAEAHGGNVTVLSKLKEGSTFTVRLAVNRSSQSVVQLTEK